jgi:hypothetical protein
MPAQQACRPCPHFSDAPRAGIGAVNTADKCNDMVFSKGDVFETFLGPVAKETDAPTWYYEVDTAAVTGALWASLSHNAEGGPLGSLGGNVSNLKGGCSAVKDICGTKPVQGGQMGVSCNASDLVACSLPCTGLASFTPPELKVTVSQGEGWWGDELFIPFSLFKPFLPLPDSSKTQASRTKDGIHKLWKMNVSIVTKTQY